MKIKELDKKIFEARMGEKDLALTDTNGYTFGFEFEIVTDGTASSDPEDIWQEAVDAFIESDEYVTKIEWWHSHYGDSEKKKILVTLKPKYGKVEITYTPEIQKLIDLLALPENTEREFFDKFVLLAVDRHGEGMRERIINKIKELDNTEIVPDAVEGRPDDTLHNIMFKNYKKHVQDKIDEYVDSMAFKFYTDESRTETIDLFGSKYNPSDLPKWVSNKNITELVDALEEEYSEYINDIEDSFVREFEQSRRNENGNPVDYLAQVLEDNNIEVARRSDGYSKWTVKTDSSIHPSGAEVVSPIFTDYSKAEEALSTMLSIISFNDDMSTNSTTGLHINIGRPEWAKNFDHTQLDLLKFLLVVGEKTVLDEFKRYANHYSKPVLKKMLEYIARYDQDSIKSSAAFNSFIAGFNEVIISKSGRGFIDPAKLKTKGYLEIRAAGGHRYEEKEEALKSTMKRVIRALNIARDPNAYRNEYYKKLYKFINNALKVSFPEYKSNDKTRVTHVPIALQNKAKTLLLDLVKKSFLSGQVINVSVSETLTENITSMMVNSTRFVRFIIRLDNSYPYDESPFSSHDIVNIKDMLKKLLSYEKSVDIENDIGLINLSTVSPRLAPLIGQFKRLASNENS